MAFHTVQAMVDAGSLAIYPLEPDNGTSHVRNISSSHGSPWLAPKHRCLVPFTCFSAPGRDQEGCYCLVGFVPKEAEPLAF